MEVVQPAVGAIAGGAPRVRAAPRMTIGRGGRSAAAETIRVTVLFADLRGYTRLAERLAPARVVPLLEEFFAILSSATELHGGRVYHMAGDGMMAGFGLEHPGPDGARDALAAGYTMLQKFRPVATRWRRELSIEAGVGVGLHQGEVAMGFLGPRRQKTATLVGDTVNVAARLCSRARAGEVLFSRTIAAALEAGAATGPTAGLVPFLQLPQFELRGRSELLDIWCVPALERLAV